MFIEQYTPEKAFFNQPYTLGNILTEQKLIANVN